jgi:hypothetical protein
MRAHSFSAKANVWMSAEGRNVTNYIPFAVRVDDLTSYANEKSPVE